MSTPHGPGGEDVTMHTPKGPGGEDPPGPRLAAIYARVSSEEQAKRGYSIPTQLEACQALAVRDGYTVPEGHVFVDDGITGTTLERR